MEKKGSSKNNPIIKNNDEEKTQRTRIELRIDSDIKEKWQNFVNTENRFSNLTSFIKYVVNSYIDGDFSEIEEYSNDDKSLIKRLHEIEEGIIILKKDRFSLTETLNVIKEQLTSITSKKQVMEIQSISDQILSILEIGDATYTQISNAIHLEEPDTLTILHNLEKRGLVISIDEKTFSLPERGG